MLVHALFHIIWSSLDNSADKEIRFRRREKYRVASPPGLCIVPACAFQATASPSSMALPSISDRPSCRTRLTILVKALKNGANAMERTSQKERGVMRKITSTKCQTRNDGFSSKSRSIFIRDKTGSGLLTENTNTTEHTTTTKLVSETSSDFGVLHLVYLV